MGTSLQTALLWGQKSLQWASAKGERMPWRLLGPLTTSLLPPGGQSSHAIGQLRLCRGQAVVGQVPQITQKQPSEGAVQPLSPRGLRLGLEQGWDVPLLPERVPACYRYSLSLVSMISAQPLGVPSAWPSASLSMT